jgi:hypothetical protein
MGHDYTLNESIATNIGWQLLNCTCWKLLKTGCFQVQTMEPHVQRVQLIMSHVYVILVICTHTRILYIYINIKNSDKSSYKSHGFCSAPRTLLRGRIEGKIFGYHIQQLGTGHNEEKLQAPAERILCTAAPEWFLIILLLFILIFSNIHQNLDIIWYHWW